MNLRVRNADRDDLMLTYGWVNDPLSLEMNFRRGSIPLDTYARFFNNLLMDKGMLYLIAEWLHGEVWTPVAQVRIHADSEISLIVAPEYRGKHLAVPVITAALEFAKGTLPLDSVTAHIKRDNIPSIRAFERAGFIYNGETAESGLPTLEYVYDYKKAA